MIEGHAHFLDKLFPCLNPCDLALGITRHLSRNGSKWLPNFNMVTLVLKPHLISTRKISMDHINCFSRKFMWKLYATFGLYLLSNVLVGSLQEYFVEIMGSWSHVNFTLNKKLVWPCLLLPLYLPLTQIRTIECSKEFIWVSLAIDIGRGNHSILCVWKWRDYEVVKSSSFTISLEI